MRFPVLGAAPRPASATGLPFPDWQKVRIIRLDPSSGKTKELPVNVEELFKDWAKDVWLRDGDLILVPEK